jgi:cyclophilin family peptidyl-prolyl cis-trans isomerase
MNDKKNVFIVSVVAVALIVGVWYYFGRGPEVTVQPDAIADQITILPAAPAPAEISEEVVPPTDSKTNPKTMPTVKISTNKGDITIELYKDDAPKTVENFLTLVNKSFYDNTIFHRVISGFMIQGGDPTGTGMGGPGYKFEDELNASTESYKTGYARGTVAMANSGPNTNGSQFFIMHADYPLPHLYTIFGKVISGMETVDAIAGGKTDGNDRPIAEVKMLKVEVVQ